MKTLHPLASGRIFLLCETGRQENARFLLLRLIDINMKYSGVVLIRLWFSNKSKWGGGRKKIFSWTRIFLAKIFCLHTPGPPSPFLPRLQRHSSTFWGAQWRPTLGSPLLPAHGRQASQRVPSQEDIFSRSGIWLLGSCTSSCAGSRGWPGSVVCLGCLLGLSPTDTKFSLQDSAALSSPLTRVGVGENLEHLRSLPLASGDPTWASSVAKLTLRRWLSLPGWDMGLTVINAVQSAHLV